MNALLDFFGTKLGIVVCLFLAALGIYLLWIQYGPLFRSLTLSDPTGVPIDAFLWPWTWTQEKRAGD